MPAIKIFCPCCGSETTYSPELFKAIEDIVNEYFSKNEIQEDRRFKAPFTREAKIKAFTLHFTRRITGETWKVIGQGYKMGGERAGSIDARLEKYISETEVYRKIELDLMYIFVVSRQNLFNLSL